MDKIVNLKPGTGYELTVKIISIQPVRKTWKCFSCGQQGLWKTKDEFLEYCPNCNAQPSTEKGKGVWIQQVTSAVIEDETGRAYLDLWNRDISRFNNGDTIHLINCFAKQSADGKSINVSKGKYGMIELMH